LGAVKTTFLLCSKTTFSFCCHSGGERIFGFRGRVSMTGCLRCRPKGGGSKLRTENGFGFAFAPFPFSRARFSERPGAGKGARFLRGGGKSFPGLKRVCGADAWRRGPFWNMDVKGKGASAVFIAAPPRRACDALCAWISLYTRCSKSCTSDCHGCCRC